MTDLRQRLLRGDASLCFWGMGYVGFSAAAFFASRGVRVVGVDPDPRKVAAVREGRCPVRGFDAWLRAAGVDPAPRIRAGALAADIASEWGVVAHHVAVPTERDGHPYEDALLDACRAIAYRFGSDSTVVIESTVAPAMLDAVEAATPGLHLVAAPRRDWFDSPDRHLGALPRIFGSDETAALVRVAD